MKSVLILGVGGTGSRAVNLLQKKISRAGQTEDVKIVSVVFDTNAADEKNIDAATVISLAENATVGMVRNRLGAQCNEWFPCDHKYDENNLSIGAGQWRKQSYLAFLNAMNDTIRRNDLDNALQKLVDQTQATFSIDIYTVASLAGGTGSGSFIPLTLYVKKRLRQMFPNATVRARAMLACPDIYEAKQNGDRMNITSIYANAYAILRELNGINQVVYGLNGAEYDNGKGENARRGRTPVNFRIGSEDSPVGVLFDSKDKKYHSPTAAPFERVCLMEKIINVSAVAAHDEAMANTLYSLICTRAGGELDGIWSNEEKKRAGETGHNCMYAGIGSSEIQYPIDTLLEYFAWRKTRDDVEGEWLLLHNATEAQIAEKRKLAKEMRKEYRLSTEEYAKLFLDAQKAEERTETGNITEIIRNATRYYERRDGKEEQKLVFNTYFARLKEALERLIPDHSDIAAQIASDINPVKTPFFLAPKTAKEAAAQQVINNAEEVYDYLNGYYKKAVEAIRSQIGICADAVLPLDLKKDPVTNLDLSFVHNVLTRDGKHVHPVAAMMQLCTLRLAIADELARMDSIDWKDLSSFEVGSLPFGLLECTDDVSILDLGAKTRKSAYLKRERARFTELLSESGKQAYSKEKTDYETDNKAIIKDGDLLITALKNQATQMLLRRVLTLVADRANAMIESYRSFFRRFTEQKSRLSERVKRAEMERSASSETSCIYVGASVESRRKHYERLVGDMMGGADSGIAGKGVFSIAYGMACAKRFKAEDDIKVDTTSVFSAMYEANKNAIKHSDYYQEIASKNVLEVIADENVGAESDVGRRVIATAYEMAKPALRVNETGMQKEQAVVLVPEKLEEYLEANTHVFDLAIGGGDARACADDLIGKWCQNALVRLEAGIPANTVYVCRALMSVDSIDIIKVNENNLEDGYYKYYLETVKMAGADYSKCGDGSRYSDDSKLPHLGFNWHKRGYLPYINAELEAAADRKMVKALLYAIMNDKISFKKEYGDLAFRYDGEKIVGDGKFVDDNNLVGLIAWLRPQDDKIALWSEAFDRDVEEQLASLPSTGFVHQIGKAKTALTQTKYLKMLRRNLFENLFKSSSKEKASAEDEKKYAKIKKKLDMNIFEFAYRIKTEEEGHYGYDCNDGEKILAVVSDLLWALCERVVSSDKDQFKEVYEWELDYFVAEMYFDDDMPEDEADRTAVVKTLLHFANRAGCFMEIVPSRDPSEKWEKRDFNLFDFLENRASALDRVAKNRAKSESGIPSAPSGEEQANA